MSAIRKDWTRPQPRENLPDPDGSVRAVDPTGMALRDADALIFVRGAFQGVVDSAAWERTRSVLGNPLRRRRIKSEVPLNPLLPIMRCGAEGPDGRRCGAAVRGARNGDTFRYLSPTCKIATAGHTAYYESGIEEAVLAIVGARVSSERLLEDVEQLAPRLSRIQQRIAVTNKRLARLDDDLFEVGRAELEARRDGREEDKRHWALLRAALRTEQQACESELTRLSASETALSDKGRYSKLAAEVRALAVDVSQLLQQSRAIPGLTAQLIGTLTRSISIKSVAENIALLEIVFPHGEVVQSLALTRTVVCTQPERVAAFTLLRQGMAPKEVAKRMMVKSPLVQPSRGWSERSVLTLGILHSVCETVPPRSLSGEPIEELAERLILSADETFEVCLTGALGPLHVDDHLTWRLSPTEQEMERVSIEYARRRTAERMAWPLEDTVRAADLAEAHGRSMGNLTAALSRSPTARAADSLGRVFVNERLLPSRWLRTNADSESNRAAACRRYDEAVRSAVKAAGFEDHQIGDFLESFDLVRILRANCGRGSRASLAKAIQHGAVIAIPYQGPAREASKYPPRQLVYCPKAIRESSDATVVMEWLGGPRRRREAHVRAHCHHRNEIAQNHRGELHTRG